MNYASYADITFKISTDLRLLEAPSQVATITRRKHFFSKITTAFQNNENTCTAVTFVAKLASENLKGLKKSKTCVKQFLQYFQA